MKNLLLLLFLSPLFSLATNKYYVATTGSDNNPGTMALPFKTWAKLSSVMVAGDTAFIRGGTYRSTQGDASSAHCYMQNLQGNPGSWIVIQNYPGEQPVLNLDNIVPTYTDPFGMYVINCTYVRFKGLRITGLPQHQGGSGISRGFGIMSSPNCIFEQIEVDHIGGSGFNIYDNSNDILFLNCDAHHNDDRYSNPSPWGGADGFGCTGGVNSTRITYEGCRSYWNSDDGWDNFKTDGIRTWKNCWSFFNGYEPGTFTPRGNGEGFKLGPTNTDQSTVTLRFLQNCVAFSNYDNGFDQNGTPTTLYQLYNNTSYKNGGDGFNFQYFVSTALTQTFKNNVAYGNSKLPLRYTGSNVNNTNNSWNGSVTVNAADFSSLDTTGVTGPRQADGSLPLLPFVRLVAGSDLVNAGTPVGLPYSGSAPDMGAYEYGTIVNLSPVANSGTDQVITLPVNSVTLSGSGTDPDGTVSSYLWTKISGPTAGTITNISAASTSVTGMTQGIYKFELKVTDNNGATDTDTMQVTVNAAVNQRPSANAGPDQNIALPLVIATLSGSGTDPDGTISAYQWSLVSGPNGSIITNLLSALTTVTGLAAGVYKFQLTVTDNSGATAADTMQLTVTPLINQLPAANAGPDQAITLPANNVSLAGSGSDPDGTISSYLWSKISGPANGTITNTSAAASAVTGLSQGIYTFELKVTDNSGATDTDTMQVTVNAAPNQLPVANAGNDQVITLPTNSVSLSGSGTDPDGTVSSYVWTKVSGPAGGTITNTNSATTTVTGMVQGIYQFQLLVTDNAGSINTDIMQVTVNAAANQAPVANAGNDQVITLPTNSVSLSGSGTDPDGTISGYRWRKISGPTAYTINNTTTAATAVSGLVQGIYQFEFRVTDNNGATGRDTMVVTVNAAINQLPAANAGIDQVITLPVNNVSLSGSGTDPDGTITGYHWVLVSGPAGSAFTNSSASATTVTGLTEGIYLFELMVTDNDGATDNDTMQLTVNPAVNESPVADAGFNQTITLPTSIVALSGSGTDPDGTISAYSWTKISGPANETITDATSAITTVTGLVSGVYQFQLEVTDNSGATATDIVQVNVNSVPPPPNQAPVANAGADKNITLPTNTTSLNGSGTDADGTISAYFWRKISGPTNGSVTNAASANANAVNLVQGTYKFELKVTDNNGATGRDTVLVIVNPAPNQLPTANAGSDKTITSPTSSSSLNGSGTDPDGFISSYHWTKITGPANGNITNAAAANTTITGLVQGIYEFELKVTDNNGATDTDTMKVTVNAAPNQAPTAEAGLNQTITLPVNTITLSGSGTDPDGTITAYLWTKISGPASGLIANINSATTTVTGLTQGVYQFQLQVTDNNGAIDSDFMQVNVLAANILPTADAGLDQIITLPTNFVSLNGNGTDPDGTIAAYTWTKISGPANGTITNAGSASASANGLVQGIYKFQLKVTDNNGATDTDTMQVTVNPVPNQVPVANAGSDQIITLPVNSVSLTGSGTDPDGNITAYQWIKISGPSGASITSLSSASTTVTGLLQGIYQFQLTVTDNSGAIDSDTIQVIVNPAPNQLPTANAGSDQSITLPVNSVNLFGSGTDPDGTIAAYLWTKISGPANGNFINSSAAITSVTGLVQGVYKFQLKVTDNNGATDTDTLQVTVNAANLLPTANAGLDQNLTLPTNIAALNGSGTDPDGTITTYLWTKISGPTNGTITNASTAATSVTGLTQGVYKFQLKVTDNSGATDTDTMQVTVNPPLNQAPTANAGSDKTIILPTNSVSLTGSGTDPDGTITAYAWTKISGPTNGTITNASAAATSVTGLVLGVYKFQLKVTDNNGATDTDTIQVTVNAANLLPTANAGLDQNLTLPTNIASLNGSGTDTDGTITAYSWTKISGPLSGSITNANTAATTVTGLTQGVYKFQLKVTDNNGATDTDTMQVTVNPAINQPPTSNAGTDLYITLPVNSVNLSGIGSDPDGVISSYLWTKISGPAAGTITNPISATTSATGLIQGIYKFQLKVTDNSGATDFDTMQVTVNPAVIVPNVAPTAHAGVDQTITLPVNSVNLAGSGTDTDGTIVAYLWTKISGPSAGSITNAAAATTSVTGMVQGVYKFQLKVTDNSGATDTDTMQVTVNPAVIVPNIAPTAHAGIDQTITLPVNSVTLAGSGTDPDGTITNYLWTIISGPVNGTITNAASATTTITGLTEGIYLFQLTVTDNDGATGTETMQVTVNAAIPVPNIAPSANAGADTSIYLPADSIVLSGNGTDPDGTIAAYSWAIVSGGHYNLNHASNATANLSGLQQGIYEAELTVTDNDGAIARDTIKITVGAARVQVQKDDVIIMGNPVQNTLTAKITSTSANRITKIFLYDIRGTILFARDLTLNQNIRIEQIDMSGYSRGTYILKVYFDNKTSVTNKVIKM